MEQQRCWEDAPLSSGGRRRWFQSCIVRPTIAWPRACRIAATVELSTPPLIATATVPAAVGRGATVFSPSSCVAIVSGIVFVDALIARRPLLRNEEREREAARPLRRLQLSRSQFLQRWFDGRG